jgi:thiol-disulfide isomerase/thioredoxin
LRQFAQKSRAILGAVFLFVGVRDPAALAPHGRGLAAGSPSDLASGPVGRALTLPEDDMTRRELFLGASMLALVPLAAQAQEMLTYTPGLPQERLAAGETVFIDVSAPWCSTCRAQGRAIDDLRAMNPAYDEAITFIRMDWDTYGRSEYRPEPRGAAALHPDPDARRRRSSGPSSPTRGSTASSS